MSAKPTPRQTLHDAVSRGGSLGMAGRTLHKRNSMFNPVHVPVHMVNKAGVDGKKPDSARANAPSGAAAAATGGNIASIMQWAVKAGNGSGSVGNDAAADGPPPPAGLKARWGMATSKLLAKEAARKIKTAAKLKALQRTPQHMIINRMRLLMDRIRPPPNASPEDRPGSQNSTAPRPGPGGADAAEAAAAAAAGGAPQGPGAPAANAKRRGSSEARRGSSGTHLQGAANPAVAKLRAEPPARPGTPVADQISAVEEMSVILCYLNPFLAKMAEDARMQLCNFVQYEEISREKVVYSQGDDPQKFYLILNGIVEVATRRLGHRSKTVKKKGETFAETCLLTGEPSTETITTYSKCIFLTVAKQDFLGVLEPYLLQEKRAIVDFLTGYVGVLEDAPRGLLTALAQHIQIQDHPADKDFELINEDCLYFIRAGTCNLLSAERHTVTEGASADAGDGISQHAMSQSGPLAKVELRDGRVIGTLGRVDQRTSRKVLVAARQLSVLEPGMYFGGGDLLLGEGDLQTALSVTAITPVQLYAISLAVFAKLATPELLQAMRDELCFEMTYFHGRAGLTAPDVVVGHPTALLAQKATEEAALQRKGKSKRRRGTRSSLTGGTAAAGKPADQPGDHGLGSRVAKAVRHYTSMQAHTSDETAGDARRKRVLGDKEDEDAAAVDAATTYHNGTAAERYWASPGSEPPKKQNMVSLLGQIFPEGIAPLAEKVERQERQDTVRREALVARASLPPMPGLDLLRHVSSLASVMDDIIKQTPRGTIISGAVRALPFQQPAPADVLGPSPPRSPNAAARHAQHLHTPQHQAEGSPPGLARAHTAQPSSLLGSSLVRQGSASLRASLVTSELAAWQSHQQQQQPQQTMPSPHNGDAAADLGATGSPRGSVSFSPRATQRLPEASGTPRSRLQQSSQAAGSPLDSPRGPAGSDAHSRPLEGASSLARSGSRLVPNLQLGSTLKRSLHRQADPPLLHHAQSAAAKQAGTLGDSSPARSASTAQRMLGEEVKASWDRSLEVALAPVQTAPASGALAGQLLSAEISEFKTARKLAQAGGLAASGSGTIAPSSARSSEAGAAMRATGGPAKESIDGARPQPAASADQRAAPAPGDPPAVPSLKLGGLQPHSGRLGVALSDRTGLDASVGARLASSLQRYAMVPGVDAPRASHRKHYSAGEKLAAALIWEASSGRHPSPHLRQVMTYGEIRQKKQDSMRGDPVAIDQRELERLLAAFHPKKQ